MCLVARYGECLRGYKPRAAYCSRLAPRVTASCLAKPSCYQLFRAGITRCAVLRYSLCLCIVSVVERCHLTDIKGKKDYFVSDSMTVSMLCGRAFTHLLAQGALTVSSSDHSG